MAFSSNAASLFMSLGLLNSVCWTLVIKPAHVSHPAQLEVILLEQVPLPPGPSIPSHTQAVQRNCLFVCTGPCLWFCVKHYWTAVCSGKWTIFSKFEVWWWWNRDCMGWYGGAAFATSPVAEPFVTPCSAAPTSASVPTAPWKFQLSPE